VRSLHLPSIGTSYSTKAIPVGCGSFATMAYRSLNAAEMAPGSQRIGHAMTGVA
jgi:hypothetical protein